MRAPASVLTPGTVLITGATGGIGAALARAYAKTGRTLVLHGRNTARLAEVCEQCRNLGATVRQKVLDLRDTAALRAWLGELEVDLAIVNAGVTSSIADGESWTEVEQVLDVNVKAAFATVQALLPAMRSRGAGQIALISSIAAYYGLPATPAYSASKAALKAYGEALRGWLEPSGVSVNVVLPGFVRTEMSRRFPGPKLFMLSPEDAAERITRGLARNQACISFPLPLSAAMRVLGMLPAALSQRIVRSLGYGA